LEPIPRPTRTFLMREPAGGFKFDNEKRRTLAAGVDGLCCPRDLDLRPLESFFTIFLFHHFHEVTNLVNHALN
jgi:hypothetical protein